MDPSQDNTANSKPRKKVRKPLTARRLRRKLWRGVLFLVFLFLLGLFVLTRTGVTKAVILPRLQAATNLDISSRSVIIASDLSLVMRDVSLRMPGLDGEAGELLVVDKLVAHLDWLDLPSPAAIRRIELESPRLRVSQSKDSGEINVSSPTIFRRVRSGETSTLPTVIVSNGIFEMGEYDRSGYDLLAEVPFSGVLAPQRGGIAGRSHFSLTPLKGESSLELTGMIDNSGVTFSLGGLVLDEWPDEAVPSRLRGLWERLALVGRIVPRRVTISPAGDVEVVVNVDRVAITLPFDAESARSDERVRLTDVNGSFLITERTISADLTGRISSLTQHVVFDLWGFDAKSSPFIARFTTEPFRLEHDLELLNYVPEIVHEQNKQFGHPEADVDADIWLARGSRPEQMPAPMTGRLDKPDRIGASEGDWEDDEIRLDGVLTLSNGTAAFEGFPYRFHDMFGIFHFTKSSLKISDLRGVGPTGAKISGGGVISPLGETAAVDLDLRVESLPIDGVLKDVLSPSRRELLEALISEREYRDLVDAGLLRPWEEAKPMLDRLETIEVEREAWTAGGIAEMEIRRLDAERDQIEAELEDLPGFRLGGTASAHVRIKRHEGTECIWERDIELVIDEIGLLSKFFPLPTIGHDVRFRITDGHSTFRVKNGRTLSGGKVTVDARMLMGEEDDPPAPHVTIKARDVPIDNLLIHAIAGPDSESENEGPGELTRLLGELGLAGAIDSDAVLFPDNGRVGYRIESVLRDVSSSIGGGEVVASGIGGEVVVEPSRVSLDLTGTIEPAGVPVRVDDARLSAVMVLPEGRSWGDDIQGRAVPMIEASLSLPGSDLRIPAERLIEVLDEDTAEQVRRLRKRHRPEGVLDVEASLAGRLEDGGIDLNRLTVAVTGVDRIFFDAEGMRIGASSSQGSASIHLVGRRNVVFKDFSVELSADGVPSGRVGITDAIALDETPGQASWNITLKNGRFESPLTRLAVRKVSTGTSSLLDEYDLQGIFDLDLHRQSDGVFEGTVEPISLSVATRKGRVDFVEADGSVEFNRAGGELDDLVLSSPGTTLRASGRWVSRNTGADLNFTFDLDAQVVSDPLWGLAPTEIGVLFDTLEAGADGPVRISNLRIITEAPGPDGVGRFDVSGKAEIHRGRLNFGVPMTELDGVLKFESRRGPGDAEPVFAVSLEAERWRLFGLRMTGGRVEVLSGREPGSVLVPTLSADAHGGRFTGTVRMARSPRSPGSPGDERRYWADVQLAEVRLAPLLEDVTIEEDGVSLADEVREDIKDVFDASEWDQSEDRSRGYVSASLTLAGLVGSDTDRRGRGRVIASGGPVVMLPLLTPLIEFSNLQPPFGDELRIAVASFFVDGNSVSFEDIAVLSDSVELIGYGEITLPDAELDLRVRSQAVRRIPVVSGVIETVRDELFTTRLTGPVGDPKFSAESFAATRRVMGSLLGGDENLTSRRLRDIGLGGGGARQRIRTAESLMDRIGAGEVSPNSRGGNDVP